MTARDLADAAGVVDYAYSRDGSKMTEEYRGMACPYADRRCDYSHCLAVVYYPDGSITRSFEQDDELAEFGYCKRFYRELLEIEKLEQK